MTSGTSFEQREIVLTPVPFTDLTDIKQRPVLILSNNEYNYKTDDLLVCGLTSILKDTQYSILIDNKNIEAGMIPLKSRIKVNKIFTLEQSLIIKKLGKLDNETFEKVKEELFKLI